MKPNASHEARQAAPSSTISQSPRNGSKSEPFPALASPPISRRAALFGGAIGALAVLPALAQLRPARMPATVTMPIGGELLAIDLEDLPVRVSEAAELPLVSQPRPAQRYAFIDDSGALRAGLLTSGVISLRDSVRRGWVLVEETGFHSTVRPVTVLGAVVEA